MYVQYFKPLEPGHHFPIVFIHGGGNSGQYFIATPGGRKGWAPYLVEKGWPVYVVDWPGHGRSFHIADDSYRLMDIRSVVTDIGELLKRTGPVILVTHSIGGMIGWKVAEQNNGLVAAVVGIAPGPPANLLPPLPVTSPQFVPEDTTLYFDRSYAQEYWTTTPLFPQQAFEDFFKSLQPESPRLVNERNNVLGMGLYVSGPNALGGIPVLVQIGDFDPRHSIASDKPIADFFNGDFIYLPNVGLSGHGHFQMSEYGNLDVADVFLRWLAKKGF
jgi:pimeloyl-ACP methyl ester carboxylesterase